MSSIEALTAALADRYEVQRELGSGGMATVYLALDKKHDRQVALKVLRPELGAVLGAERFLAEIKITARLDHPHILTLIDSGAADGLLYYVLPFARGESLREKLQREKQLGLEEAVMITKQIASALDYAHKQGVVHRDIKPENILIQEGEAMLADFGIALAVKEAGGNRLTETGLSLGTPQYMSPEQATGDRTLDARSDVYSLAAVLYEMLAGEPPVTGPSAQAMIAKLMMERPTHLRVVRESVPMAVDAAVAKALDKTPADRFATAGDFARALDLRSEPAVAAANGRRRNLIAAAGAVVAVGVIVALAVSGIFGGKKHPYILRDRTQLTFTGAVQLSSITPDGKQLAFVSRECGSKGCTYSLNLQDIGGTSTRRIMDGATSGDGLIWSPDRRNLIYFGTIKSQYGAHLVSALGGPTRFLSPAFATFWAGGDSLLIAPGYTPPDSVHYVRVAGIDGGVRDSIAVAGLGNGVFGLSVSPSGKWIIALIIQKGHGFWQVIGRDGKVFDKLTNSCTYPGQVTDGALWLTRAGRGFESIIRLSLDPATGKLGQQQDTLYSGRFNNFTVTADGNSLVIDDGTTDYSTWALEAADAWKGTFPESRRLVHASTPARGRISPDGQRLFVRRIIASTSGGTDQRLSIMPFAGGSETPFPGQGSPLTVFWTDSVTMLTTTQTPRGLHIALVDIRNGTQLRATDIPDSIISAVAPLPDGFAWIPATRDRVILQREKGTSEIPRPAMFSALRDIAVSPDGKQLAIMGWNMGTSDSVVIAIVPTEGGAPAVWFSRFAEDGVIDYAADGSLVLELWPTRESIELYRLKGPGQSEKIGAIARAVEQISWSRDLKRVAVVGTEYKGDAWLSRVSRQ